MDNKRLSSVISELLKQYKALKVYLDNKRELEENGLPGLFPAVVDRHELKQLQFTQINRAIESLDPMERQIIDQKFLSPIKEKDLSIYSSMGINKDKYYKFKGQALIKIAIALNLI
ncbi:ArpU family phage packaging/lysis transcriptional regulator [Bacillus infantis]|uniref:ArpU family phage packaging/lysis transcriptional regulator n=1 Tax=Bacillus infantis TaxID=324767 RepID=UPI003CEC06C3